MREGLQFEEAKKRVGIGQSLLCDGQGVFSLEPIGEGEVVFDYSVTKPSRTLTPFECLPQSAINTHWWVGASCTHAYLFPPESLFMRANHSRTPNCEWNLAQETLISIRDIAVGEELTYDYRKDVAPTHIKSNPPPWA